MFMLTSKHKEAMKTAADDYANALSSIKSVADLQRAIDQRALDAERSITKSLRAGIEELRPLANKYTAKLERDRAHAANKRKVAK